MLAAKSMYSFCHGQILRKKYSLFSLGLVWGGDEPDDVLKGEPTDENRFSNLKEIFLP